MKPVEGLTDEVIERIAGRFVARVPGAFLATQAYNEDRLRRILVDVLLDERRPVHEFVVEVRDESRVEAASRLGRRLAPCEDMRIIRFGSRRTASDDQASDGSGDAR